MTKLSAICMGQPPTVISEVGPSAEGALFFQITRTNELEAPHGVLPAALFGVGVNAQCHRTSGVGQDCAWALGGGQ